VTPDDSARKRKMRKMMSLNCSICLMPISGVEKVMEFGLPKRSSPVQHVDVCVILPAFCGFIVSGELLRRSEPHVASPKTECHTLQRVDLASKSKLGFV